MIPKCVYITLLFFFFKHSFFNLAIAKDQSDEENYQRYLEYFESESQNDYFKNESLDHELDVFPPSDLDRKFKKKILQTMASSSSLNPKKNNKRNFLPENWEDRKSKAWRKFRKSFLVLKGSFIHVSHKREDGRMFTVGTIKIEKIIKGQNLLDSDQIDVWKRGGIYSNGVQEIISHDQIFEIGDPSYYFVVKDKNNRFLLKDDGILSITESGLFFASELTLNKGTRAQNYEIGENENGYLTGKTRKYHFSDNVKASKGRSKSNLKAIEFEGFGN